MHELSEDEWFARIARPVADFHSEHFQLGRELRHVYLVRQSGAPEAIVFYGARMLEALAAAALTVVQIPPSVNVFSNLVTLEQYSLLDSSALHSTHAMRRLGNVARHIQGELTAEHADLSLALTEQVLEWFFLNLPVREPINGLCNDSRSLPLANDATLRTSLSTAHDVGQTWQFGWAELKQQQGPALLRLGQTAAIVAELWLDRNKTGAAHDLLLDALKQFPDDLRLQQLMLLAMSRQRDYAAAIAQVDRLMKSNGEDEETMGIAAGLYKRLWNQDRKATDWLAKAQKLYRNGWNKSKQNAYLGINAATTALWLGKPDESQQLAGKIDQLLRSRAAQLQQSGFPHVRPDYWTQVSLAEALLLERKVPEAAAAYQSAIQQFPDKTGSIDVTLGQMRSIAETLGISVAKIEELIGTTPAANG